MNGVGPRQTGAPHGVRTQGPARLSRLTVGPTGHAFVQAEWFGASTRGPMALRLNDQW